MQKESFFKNIPKIWKYTACAHFILGASFLLFYVFLQWLLRSQQPQPGLDSPKLFDAIIFYLPPAFGIIFTLLGTLILTGKKPAIKIARIFHYVLGLIGVLLMLYSILLFLMIFTMFLGFILFLPAMGLIHFSIFTIYVLHQKNGRYPFFGKMNF